MVLAFVVLLCWLVLLTVIVAVLGWSHLTRDTGPCSAEIHLSARLDGLDDLNDFIASARRDEDGSIH